MKYILIKWPESQEYMEYPWFRQEAYLLSAFEDQEHHDSAYFIPEERVIEHNKQGITYS